MIASPLADFENPHDFPPPEEVFDRGVHLPLGGSPFGLAALSTPDASVGGESASPIVDMDTVELLQHDAANRMLARAGVTDAEDAEWIAGPEAVSVPGDRTGAELLGTATDLETFVGVVSGTRGSWGVFLTVARITDDDHVVAATAIARPVGSPDSGMAAVEGSGWGMDPGPDLPFRAVEFSAAAIERLERA